MLLGERDMTVADIIQIIIGILSLIATVFVSFFIYWLQTRHEKELRRQEELEKYKLLVEKAHTFLIDNEEERDFLPWCIIASNLHRHEKHTRSIYTNFCRCSEELQSEILKQAQFNIDIISDTEWVDTCIEKLQNDIKRYNFGRDYLYDGAKYLHRGFERYREEKWEPLENRYEFKQHISSPAYVIRKRTTQSFLDYVDEYAYLLWHSRDDFEKYNPKPPIDYLWEHCHLGYADEKEVCRWIIEAVHDVALIFNNNFNKSNILSMTLTDALPESFEDKYYQTLYCLYCLYCFTYPNNSIEKAKKRTRKNKRNMEA